MYSFIQLAYFTIDLNYFKVACLRKCCRKVWDTVIYFLVLKPRAKVPSHDTFIAVRISGPGLASNYFYQVNESA